MASPLNSHCILPSAGLGEMVAEQTPLSFLVASFQISLCGCACSIYNEFECVVELDRKERAGAQVTLYGFSPVTHDTTTMASPE